MNNNTVRKTEFEPAQFEQPQVQPVAQPLALPQKVRWSGLEKLLIGVICAVVASMMVFLIQSTIGVSTSQRQLQDVQAQITKINASNVDLKQEAGELSSSDRLAAYAAKNGLSFNDASVRNVTK